MVICEGKTKKIIRSSQKGEVIIETKDDLTGGDAAIKEQILGISKYKTKQAANVFGLLRNKGIPTSFIEQMDDRRLRCFECQMLPLELVIRRYGWGSYLKRNPSLVSTPQHPYRFDELQTEFFHKDAVIMPPLVASPQQISETEARQKYLVDGKWHEGVYTDPIIQPCPEEWELYSAKSPMAKSAKLMAIKPIVPQEQLEYLIDEIMVPTFSLLEEAWNGISCSYGQIALVDLKIEVGRKVTDNKLVVSDVIDNDSWRIWPQGNPTLQLDKQLFREGHPLAQVEDKYQLVANLTDQFIT